MLSQYLNLGYSTPDPACLCNNINFSYSICDYSNGAYSTAVASTVIAFKSTYYLSAFTTQITTPIITAIGISALPSYSQVCWSNIQGQYSTFRCVSTSNAAYLCNNVNFRYNIWDYANSTYSTAIISI
jgi:hypothetical protein